MAEFLAAGEVFERYEVVRPLGSGGMAEVVLVRHTTLQTLHALKVLTLAGPTLKERLVEEGRIQAILRHPNVVWVSDVLTVKGMPALVMEFVDGPDLNVWIQEHEPDQATAEQLFRGIVAGVAAAHEAGQIHRDLKPANILVDTTTTTPDGSPRPKITDFGLVKAVQGDPSGRTRTGLPLGTPQYMAPEQIRSAKDVDQRADIWSLGCILYEMLAHAPAYPGEDLVDLYERATRRERPALPEGTEPRLVRTVERCLAPDPADRPQDCAAILALLEDRSMEIGAIPIAPPRPAKKPNNRTEKPPARIPSVSLTLLTLGGSVLAVLTVALTVMVAVAWQTSRPVPPCAPGQGPIGYARAPWVFDKPPGSVWRIREPTPVGPLPPAEVKVVRPVCTLPPGARVRVTGPPTVRGASAWVPIHGERLAIGSPDAPLTEDERQGVVGERCQGEPGERIGWVYTRPANRDTPKADGRWELTYAREVYASPPTEGGEPGPVVCALRAQTAMEVVEQPTQTAQRDWWLPLTAGRFTEP